MFSKTLLLVGLPLVIYLPIAILNFNSLFLINKLFPEFILVVAILGILLSNLIIDPLITISTTWLYIVHKEKKL